MPSFNYRAIDTGGKPVAGVVTAENYQVALRMLEEQALYPVNVSEGGAAGVSSMGRRRKVKTSQLTIFFSQLSDLLRAGVPMLRSLDVLSKQEAGSALSAVVKELREDVAGGASLGDAMSKHPHAFSTLHASMVRAGEQGGFLEDVLQRASIFAEKQDELKNKVVGAMIYPSILVFAGGGVVLLLMGVVVPKLGQFLRPENYNILTHIVLGGAKFLQTNYMFMLMAVTAIVIGVVSFLKTDYGQHQVDKFKLKAPVLGNIMTLVAICRFCRIQGTMLQNGVQILAALKIAKDSAGNSIIAKVIEDAAESVRKGAALSAPLADSGYFPGTIVDMISVAEESNNLESVLVQIAETYEKRTARSVDLGVRIIEPVLLIVMAVIVMTILIALLLPILTMSQGMTA